MGRWGLVQQGLEHGRLLKGEPPAFLFKRPVRSLFVIRHFLQFKMNWMSIEFTVFP